MPPPRPEAGIFGANYFPGWWDGPGNQWSADGYYILDRHPERTPLLGVTASPGLLAREAEAAHAHGISFFNFLWYGVGIQKPLEDTERARAQIAHIHDAFNAFLQISPESPLRFSIEWVNHDPWCAIDERVWRRLVESWVPIFANARYMTVDGRLLFKIHSWHEWATRIPDRAQRRDMIGHLRRLVLERTGKGMLIGAGVRRLEPVDAWHPLATDWTFDFTSIYLDVPNMVATEPDFIGPGDFPYDELEMHQSVGRALHAYDVLPFVPNVVVGFRSLCAFQHHLPRFVPPTPEQFAGAIRAALRDARRFPGLRFPAAEPIPLVLIYAWNEFGEGGFLAPSAAFGTSYLEVLRSMSIGSGDGET